MRELRITVANTKTPKASVHKTFAYQNKEAVSAEIELSSKPPVWFQDDKKRKVLPPFPKDYHFRNGSTPSHSISDNEDIIVTEIDLPKLELFSQEKQPESEPESSPLKTPSDKKSKHKDSLTGQKIKSKKSSSISSQDERLFSEKIRRESCSTSLKKTFQIKFANRANTKKAISVTLGLAGIALVPLGVLGLISNPIGWITLATLLLSSSIFLVSRLPRQNEIFSLKELLLTLPQEMRTKIERYQFLKDKNLNGIIEGKVDKKDIQEFNDLEENKDVVFFAKLDENSFKTNPYYLNIYISYIYSAKNRNGNAYKISMASGTPPAADLAEANRRYGF